MRKLLAFLCVFLLVAIGSIHLISTWFLTPECVRSELLTRLSPVFDGRVTIKKAFFGFPSSLTIQGVNLASPDGLEVFLDLKQCVLSLDLWALTKGQVRLSEVSLEGLELQLKRGSDGRFTFERYLKLTAAARGPHRARSLCRRPLHPGAPFRWLLAGAVGAAPDSSSSTPGVTIDRILIRGSRLHYVGAYLPLKIINLVGALSLGGDRLEVLELRGRAFDQFMVSVRGTMSLYGTDYDLELKLDESPLKPLISFIPTLNLAMSWNREQIKGMAGATVKFLRDERGEAIRVKVGVKDLVWTSPSVLGATLQSAETTFSANILGDGDQARTEGDLTLSGLLLRPTATTNDMVLSSFKLAFDLAHSFLRFKNYSGTFRQGTVSGSGFYNLPGSRPGDYEIGYAFADVPLEELGLGSGKTLLPKIVVSSAKGRVLPTAVILSTGEFRCGGSKLLAQGRFRPDGPVWLVKEAQARLDLDGGELAVLLGLQPIAKVSGSVSVALFPTGAFKGLRGTGRIEKGHLTFASPRGGPGANLDLDGGTIEMSNGRLSLAELKGRTLSGQIVVQATQTDLSDPKAGARINVDLKDADLTALGAFLGAGDFLKGGRGHVTGQLRATSFSGTIMGERVRTVIPAQLKETASKLRLAEFDFSQVSSRILLTSDGVDMADIRAIGPHGNVSGSARIDGAGRVAGQLVFSGNKSVPGYHSVPLGSTGDTPR